jgi:cyclophilin family peptidyl-prolyl cis-trans isomerase
VHLTGGQGWSILLDVGASSPAGRRVRRIQALGLAGAFFLALPPAGLRSAPLVRLESNLGTFEMELLETNAPVTTANFLKYASSGRYDGTIVHRSVPDFVLQSGGFALRGNNLVQVPTFGTITNEPGLSNLRGTVAMAKLGGDPHSATSQWFINLGDNSANLDNQNGGFTVFARVFGNGMRVADAMRRVPVYNASGADALNNPTYSELPLLTNQLTTDSLLIFSQVRKLPASTVAVSYDFASSDHGFVAGFADLPADFDPAIYELQSGHRELPGNLGAGKALFISGANRSDDLWMYWKKKITGLVPGRLYEVAMDLEIASSAAEDLVGIGGPPGEAVTVKLGATPREPLAAPDKQGWLRMNLRKGNQAKGGRDLAAVGHVAKPEDGTDNYALLHRDNRAARATARAAADGSLWLVFGTDSGFEGTTALYYTKLSAVLVPVRRPQRIFFPPIPARHFRSMPFLLAARTDSGQPLEFASSDPSVATVEGRTVTIRGVGQCVITAWHAGDDLRRPVHASRVLTVGKARQVLTFLPPAEVPFASGQFDLDASSDAGSGEVIFTASPAGILEITGRTARIVGRGAAVVTARHPGTDSFLPARVARRIVVR